MKILNSIIRYVKIDEFKAQHPNDWSNLTYYRDANGVENSVSLLPDNQYEMIKNLYPEMVRYIYVDVPDIPYESLTSKDLQLLKTDPPVIILTPYNNEENLAVTTPLYNEPVDNTINEPIITPVNSPMIDEPTLPPIIDEPTPPEIYVVPTNEEIMRPIEEAYNDYPINSDPGYIDLNPIDNFPIEAPGQPPIYIDPAPPVDGIPINNTPATTTPAQINNQLVKGIDNKILIGGGIILLLLMSK